jgi:predicted Zn-dependent protease
MCQDIRHSYSEPGCWRNDSTQPILYIGVALGAIFLIGGIFFLLATYDILPRAVTLITLRGDSGLICGYTMTAFGAIGIVYSLGKLVQMNLNTESSSHSSLILEPADSPAPENWKNQIRRAQVHDTVTAPDSSAWKTGLGTTERHQTFSTFDKSEAKEANASRNCLSIHRMDNDFSVEDIQIFEIAGIYVGHIHDIKIQFFQGPLLSTNNMRGNQYAVEDNLGICAGTCPENNFALGFTSKDLYPHSHPLNFCFGVGVWQCASGLFSIYRLRSASFEKMLKRLMKLASHEFSHMRGIEHCVHCSCTMQGCNSLSELDKTPLLFCAEDMAKICHLNKWSLQKGYQRQLEIFLNIQELCQKKGKRVDFSEEIKGLKERITSLS